MARTIVEAAGGRRTMMGVKRRKTMHASNMGVKQAEAWIANGGMCICDPRRFAMVRADHEAVSPDPRWMDQIA